MFHIVSDYILIKGVMYFFQSRLNSTEMKIIMDIVNILEMNAMLISLYIFDASLKPKIIWKAYISRVELDISSRIFGSLNLGIIIDIPITDGMAIT